MDGDADEIRRKRLERLAATSKNTSSSPASTPAKPKQPLVPLTEIAPSPIQKPKPKEKVPDPLPAVEKAPSSSSITSPSKISAAQQFAALSDEKWEKSICENVLGVTLEAGSTSLIVLDTLIMEEGPEFKMVAENWERILYSRLSMTENSLPTMPGLFDYLTIAWLKINVRLENIAKLVADPEIAQVATKRCEKLKQFAGLVMNYVGLVINPDMIDMFPQNHQYGAGYFGARLLECTDPESVYPRHFIEEFISRFADEGLQEIFSATIKSILTGMRMKRIYDDYQSCFRALMYLISFKSFAEMITLLPEWNPDYVNARSIESLTILGPFFSRPSIFPDNDPALPARYFGSSGIIDNLDPVNGVGSRNFADVKSAKSAVRDTSTIVQNHLHQLVLTLIKSGPVAKENVLAFFARVINLNQKRSRLQVNRAEVSTDGFMHNILQVCKALCDPLLDSSFSKIALIDSSFLPYNSRFDLSEETRINVDNDKARLLESEWKQQNADSPKPNFVTEIFTMTLAFHHYGLMATIKYYKDFMKELEEMQSTYERHVLARDSGRWDSLPPPVRANHEQGLARFQGEVDKLIGARLTMEAGLLDTPMLEQSIRFYDLVMMWLIKCATGHSDPVEWNRIAQGSSLGLPLFPFPEEMTTAFVVLPEWIIYDVCEFYTFLMTRKAPIFENKARDEFMTFSMCMLSNSNYIKNPYLKSKLVEILYSFTHPIWRLPNGETRGRLDGPFISHPFAKEHLIPSILRFYVDVEQTGMASQFYDKFNIRYNISQILKSIWNDVVHRVKIVQLSRNTDFFVKFVNLLMNDTTYLLDECLSKLKEIGAIQTELANPPGDNPQDQQARQTREQSLFQTERQATTYVSLANETVHMLSFLTGNPDIVEPFMATEIVGRLAAMLDFNLVALAGPRCTELKVKNPEKYRFDPKKLLGELTDIFVHLSQRQEFITSVAKDGRSYSKEVFFRAIGILSKHAIKSADEITSLVSFVESVEAVIKTDLAEEEELGDIPDEFLDPLLFTLMEEPVTLPPSGVTVDLSTIRAHLLSDQHDPFNRQPLSIDDVVPNEELKSKIIAWKASKRH